MNIGSEEGKGNDLYRETHSFLLESPLKSRYVGNIEGRGLYQGEADVLVCEGFVGNVVLKVSEGIADFIMQSAAKAVLSQLNAERDAAKQAFQSLAQQYHYQQAGGAPLLGIDGIAIICHGSSDGHSIKNALKTATTFHNRQINSQIVAELTADAPV
jgi:glycerol-3-phosphate acyltransferase PlsX